MSPVTLERRGAIAVITIDNPPVNALSRAVREGLDAGIREAGADGEVEAILLICAGRTFIAGADIREFDLPSAAPHLPDLVTTIEMSRKPVVAAIHGTALGGGLEIAMGCHYRIALPSAMVGLPEVKLGLLPGATGTQRLPRLVGAERALDMMLSGEPIDAGAANEAGLIDAVADGDDLLDAAVEYAQSRAADGARRVRDLPVARPDPAIFAAARERVAKKGAALLAPQRIIRAVELAAEGDFEAGCRAERDFFLECKESSQSRGLRHAFFCERAAGKVAGFGRETPVREIRTVAVVGAGTMGAGIAYACLAAGFGVRLMDSDEKALSRGADSVRRLFQGGIERGKISPDFMQESLQRFTVGGDYTDIGNVDLVIEAVIENMAVKKQVFAQLDAACRNGAILATNTSTLDIDAIASATSRPQDVIGLHFFSPAHVMRLLEIVRGSGTADDVIATALDLARRLRKVGVVVGNCFGFVGNRMLYSYGRENQLMLLEGAAPERIDRVLTDWGMAMGPNAVGDLAGIDVGYRIRRERTDLPDDPRFYRVADLLAEKGRYGQKTGAGIYRYEAGSRVPVPDPEVREMIRREAARLGVPQRAISDREIVERCVYGLVTEGARILEEGIAQRASDIDVVWINGYGFPRHRGGPMFYADEVGLDRLLETVRRFQRSGPMYWEPPALLVELVAKGKGFIPV